jgi:PAS domain S-box-containing protein
MFEAREEHRADALTADPVLQRTEARFRRLLEKLPAGAYTCDPVGLITFYNQHAVELWGRAPKLHDPAERFCGAFKLFAPDGMPVTHAECRMALALRDQKPYDGHELVIERPDGSRVTVLEYASPIHADDHRLLGAVNVLVDISERKRQEIALGEADRAKNEFVATLAHELRNPLAPIRNVVQILQIKGATGPDLGWALEVIERQLQHMTRLIDDLLDFSRITADKLKLRCERIDVTEVLRTAVETSRPLIEANGHELSVVRPRKPVLLDADLTRLAQVVANLLNNAAKYTPRGGKIRLSARRDHGSVTIAVRDTGVGIAPELLPRLFEMFMQAHEPASGAPDGLGIGLTLARRLVHMHGGTISAHSAGPGEGSEFRVRLPIAAGRARHGGAAARRAPATAAPATRRILIVEDNRAAALSLRTLLQLVGHDVRLSHSGADALSVAASFRPEVVLLDIGLPGMSGYDVARELRATPWGRKLLLIAVTGWGLEADRARSHSAGFDHHLVKPVEPGVLTKLLEGLRARRRRAAAAPDSGNGHWEHREQVQVLPLPLGSR